MRPPEFHQLIAGTDRGRIAAPATASHPERRPRCRPGRSSKENALKALEALKAPERIGTLTPAECKREDVFGPRTFLDPV